MSAETTSLQENLLWLVEHKSVTGSETALCDDLEQRLRALSGWEVHRTGDNLAVRRAAENRDAARPKLAFAGHLDTVPHPEGGLSVRIEGDRLYGRGSTDMKAGDAVMLALLEGLEWERSWAEPAFVFYAGEEGDYDKNGLEEVFQELPWVLEADLAFCPEPTENRLELGCVGTAQVGVTFRGTAAHSARPWLGENALTKAGEVLAELHAREPEEREIDGLTFREVMTATRAEGGVANNVVPDAFRVNVNYRFAPGKERPDVERAFEELLRGRAEFEVWDYAPSGPVDRSHPLLQRFIEATAPEVRPKQAWTDVARFATRGVSAVNFGPGTPEQAHQREEHASLALLEECHAKLEDYLLSGG